MTSSLRGLRAHAISHTLFPATSLKAAINRLGFVQADPIRSPATAQDLIMRNRVENYVVGDLDRKYASLDIEEDMLYAYGFLPRSNWRMLHPRDAANLTKLEKMVFETVKKFGPMHPKELEEHFGTERVINAWGGYSKATTRALDHLHYRGLLRIKKREKGIRVYEPVPTAHETISSKIRSRRLVEIVANILAPVPLKSLYETLTRVRNSAPSGIDVRGAVEELLKDGELKKKDLDGTTWIFPLSPVQEVPRTVKFLAPFDPLVWDRRKFELLWGWQYRFEAYTPPAKRVRGYYAMPMLWCDSVIGWANVSVELGKLKVDVGFEEKRPKDAAFRAEFDAECARMEAFLSPSMISAETNGKRKTEKKAKR